MKTKILMNQTSEGGGGTGAGVSAVFELDNPAPTSGEMPPPDAVSRDAQVKAMPDSATKTPLTREDMIEAIKAVQQPAANGQQAPPQTVSEEDFNKMFNVVRLDPARAAQILGIGDPTGMNPEQVTHLNQFAHDVVRQAVTMAAFQMQQMQRQIEEQFRPALTRAQVEAEREAKSEFFEKNPALKDYEPLLVEIKERLVAQGFKGTKEQWFSTLAGEANKVLAKVPGLKVSNPGQQQQPKTSRMSTVSTGGQGGSGVPSKGTTSGPAALFG